MLESEVLEAADLVAKTSQQLRLYAEGSEIVRWRCTQRAASYAARWPTRPGPLDLVGGAARAARLRGGLRAMGAKIQLKKTDRSNRVATTWGSKKYSCTCFSRL